MTWTRYGLIVETGAKTTAKTKVPINSARYGRAVRRTLPSNKKSILFLLISAIDRMKTSLILLSWNLVAKVKQEDARVGKRQFLF